MALPVPPHPLSAAQVLLTPTHLAIVMDYCSGGELFERICAKGPFSEQEARFFFRQLIAGVAYIHSQSVAHRDLKLENALLDGGPNPALKICDFGYSKSSLLHSAAKTTVGTPAYIAPEVLQRSAGYDGRAADVWSCGVTLFVMLAGVYPFEDPSDPRNFRKTMTRILSRTYAFPPGLAVSPEVQDLMSRIFVVQPELRLGVEGIAAHAWFRGGSIPPADLEALARGVPEPAGGMQSVEEVLSVVREAQSAPGGDVALGGLEGGAGVAVGGPGADGVDDDDSFEPGSGEFGA